MGRRGRGGEGTDLETFSSADPLLAHHLKHGGGSSRSFLGGNIGPVSTSSLPTKEKRAIDGVTDDVVEYTPRRMVAYAVIAAVTNVLFGFEMSVISGAKLYFAKEFGFRHHPVQYGISASASTLGAFVGVLLAGPTQDRLSRRTTTIIGLVLYTVGAIAAATASNFLQIVCGRVVVGLAIGVFSSVIPVYIAELSVPRLRGKLVTINQVMVVMGILLGFVVDLTYGDKWRYMLATGTPVAAALLLCFIFVTPQSPRWLLSQDRYMEAYRILVNLRCQPDGAGGHIATVIVDDEIVAIRAGIAAASNVRGMLRQRHVILAIIIGVGLAAVQQFTGVNAVNFYAQDILQDIGLSEHQSYVWAIYIGLIKLVMVLCALALVDRLGRRPLLLVALIGMLVALITIATILTVHSTPKGSLGVVAALALIAFMGVFEIGLGPVFWVLLSEMYPQAVRGVAISVGGSATWLFTFIVVVLFPLMREYMTPPGVFFFYAAAAVLSLVFIRKFVVETKGRTLEEVEALLLDRYGDREAKTARRLSRGGTSLIHLTVHTTTPGTM